MSPRAVVLVAAATALAAAGALGRGAAPSAPPRLRRITIAGFEYRPPRLEVAVGDTVEWANADIVSHSASAEDGRAFDSPDLAPRETWKTVARVKGTFAYTCALHPTMKGVLVVK